MSTRRSTGFYSAYVGASSAPPVVYTRPALAHETAIIVTVYDRGGRPMGELQTHGAIERVTWRVDGYSSIAMTLAPDIMYDKPGLISAGLPVSIQLSSDLPAWGGVMDTPTEYGSGATSLTLYSAEYMFDWALTPRYRDYTGPKAKQPRAILTDLMLAAETMARYGIRPPNLWYGVEAGEPLVEVEFSYETLLSAVGKLQEVDTRMHWFLEPVITATGMTFETVLYRDYIESPVDAILMQGRNFADAALLEQGPIFNSVTVAGQGAAFDDPETWPMVVTSIDQSSIDRHGRREYFQILPDIATENATQTNFTLRASELVARNKKPRVRFRGRVLDLPPAGFGHFRLGRRVTAELHWPGTGAVSIPVTILGMEYEAASASLTLVVEYEDEAG